MQALVEARRCKPSVQALVEAWWCKIVVAVLAATAPCLAALVCHAYFCSAQCGSVSVCVCARARIPVPAGNCRCRSLYHCDGLAAMAPRNCDLRHISICSTCQLDISVGNPFRRLQMHDRLASVMPPQLQPAALPTAVVNLTFWVDYTSVTSWS